MCSWWLLQEEEYASDPNLVTAADSNGTVPVLGGVSYSYYCFREDSVSLGILVDPDGSVSGNDR